MKITRIETIQAPEYPREDGGEVMPRMRRLHIARVFHIMHAGDVPGWMKSQAV